MYLIVKDKHVHLNEPAKKTIIQFSIRVSVYRALTTQNKAISLISITRV
jgi:hypothetical protein